MQMQNSVANLGISFLNFVKASNIFLIHFVVITIVNLKIRYIFKNNKLCSRIHEKLILISANHNFAFRESEFTNLCC